MDAEKIINEIQKIIVEANKSESIDLLIKNNLRLAGFLFHINVLENEAHRLYLDAYNERKYQTALFTRESQGTQGERANEAEIQIRDFRAIESKSEILWDKLKGVKFSTTEFIGVLTQKIAYLRRESEITKQNN